MAPTARERLVRNAVVARANGVPELHDIAALMETIDADDVVPAYSPEDLAGPLKLRPLMTLFIDESGTRYPDNVDKNGPPWFGMGGVLVLNDDLLAIHDAHAALVSKWRLSGPLHGFEIRNTSKAFAWLDKVGRKRAAEFVSDLEAFVRSAPVVGIGCVLDRAEHVAKYRPQHGRTMWLMSKTAFTITVDRAAKIATTLGCRLRVVVERSGHHREDPEVVECYKELTGGRHVFGPAVEAFNDELTPYRAATLAGLEFGGKENPGLQLADLMIFPVCASGFAPDHPENQSMLSGRKYVDFHLPNRLVSPWGLKFRECPLSYKAGVRAVVAAARGWRR